MNDSATSAAMPGFFAFIAFALLALSLWFLMRNMNARMRRMSYRQQRAHRGPDEPQAGPDETDPADSGEPAGPPAAADEQPPGEDDRPV
jgi:hypothetical protein